MCDGLGLSLANQILEDNFPSGLTNSNWYIGLIGPIDLELVPYQKSPKGSFLAYKYAT